MGRKRVQLLVLLIFVVAVTNCADTNSTANTISSTNAIDPTILDNPVTLPTPDPSITKFNYYVRDPETGVACILANMSISIKANYTSTDGDTKTAFWKIPPTAEVRGICGVDYATMALFWAEDPTLEGTLSKIAFMFGNTRNASFLQDIIYDLYMDNKTFPEAYDEGGRFEGTLKNVYKFVASKDEGLYKCAHETTVGSVEIDITITNVALIAFNTEKSVVTKTEEYCVPENEPATSPLPPPDQSVTQFNYYMRDPETGVACILANMSISIEANYMSTGFDIKTAFLKIPPTAEVRGICGGADPIMALFWAEDPTLEGTLNEIAFTFGSTGNTSYLQDIHYDLYVDNKTFPEAREEGQRFVGILKNVYIFVASKDEGLYKCALETTVGSVEIDITITNVALIAFNTEKSVATKTEENCVPENEPATSPLPPPDHSVTEFNYYVRDPETGVACILANMSISIKANYISTGFHTKTATLNMPPTVEVRGHCRGRAVPTMELIWAEDPTLEGTQNGIALMFNSTNTRFFLQDIVYDLYMDNKTFPEANEEGKRFVGILKNVYKFNASNYYGLYKCDSGTTVGTGGIEITITNIALIAFNTEESVATRTVEYCACGADAGADVGAIVGGVIRGVALIPIIIIVIVVWRNKCR